MKRIINHRYAPLALALGFLLTLIFVESGLILWLNQGHFLYTLDDPYIHLSLAENIRAGHYGLSAGVVSAPASSVGWPFLLAFLPDSALMPFFLNVAGAVAIVILFAALLAWRMPLTVGRTRFLVHTTLLLVLILSTNLVGLIFIGMEHVWQVLLIVLTVIGLSWAADHESVPPWLYIVLIVAPLIRYESGIVSLVALAFLAYRGHMRAVLLSLVVMLLPLGLFSLFLWRQELGWLPMSVSGKLTVNVESGFLWAILLNLVNTLQTRVGLLLMVAMAILSGLALFMKLPRARRVLLLVPLTVTAVHLLAGRNGWYHRYEIYVLALLLLFLLDYVGPVLARSLAVANEWRRVLLFAGWSGLVTVISFFPYVFALFTLPLAANNIYEQHYQMHRFIVDYYDRPVAVNDVGLATYRNDNEVLDLAGMASPAVTSRRVSASGSDWMTEVTDAAGVELAIVTVEWFDDIPDDWIKLGELQLGRQRVTPSSSSISFYALNRSATAELRADLDRFVPTLPAGVEFSYAAP